LRVVVEVAQDFCVLDADDERVAAMAEHSPGKPIWVTRNLGNERVRRHIRQGGRAVALEPGHYASRGDFDSALESLLEEEGIEYVLLAGYMRILGAKVVRAFRDRILNVHPSLLPAFPGARAVRDALDWGVRVTGATVHLVDEEVDHGPIVLQEPVAVLPRDDEESLHRRIKEVEHRLFPRAARLLAESRLKVEARRVHVLDDGEVGEE